jgi:hypothetical protein
MVVCSASGAVLNTYASGDCQGPPSSSVTLNTGNTGNTGSSVHVDKDCTDDTASGIYIEHSCPSSLPDAENEDMISDPVEAQIIINQAESAACLTFNSIGGCPESGKGNTSCACQSKPPCNLARAAIARAQSLIHTCTRCWYVLRRKHPRVL